MSKLLVVIFLLAGFLRFYGISSNPPALTWDEVSWGYNAFSLGIDGRDEHGRFLPYDYLEAFGDFKPPVYAYLTIFPVKIFGLNEFAVRFPSAFFGTITTVITFFMVRRLFASKDEKWKNTIALLSSFFITISPWHINLSRAAFEANVATFFLVTGVWLFLAGIQEKKWLLPISALSFVLSMYTFNTTRIVAPLLVLILALGFYKELLLRKKETIISFFIGFLILLPIVGFLFSQNARLRFQEVNIFTDIAIIERVNKEVENDHGAWWSKIVHNRRFAYSVEYLNHYFDNFTPSFLFIKGDGNPKFSTQDVGQFYLWDIPFIFLGIFLLLKKRDGFWWIIPLWIIIGIIPAATARETPHALRIETTLPTFQIITAYAVTEFLRVISNISVRGRYLLVVVLFLFLIFNFLYYLHEYYSFYPKDYSGEWQYGYKESIKYVAKVEHRYDRVIVTNILGRPYAYYLFYLKFDPREFRKNVKINHDPYGFVTIEGFGKYKFGQDLGILRLGSKNALFISPPTGIPKKAKILKTFRRLDGTKVLVAYQL